MIAELIYLQDAIKTRAVFVGNNIQQWKHYAYTGVKVPIIAPFAVNVDSEFVDVAIAYNANGRVVVSVPTPLFEAGSVGDIRTWVTRSNKAYEDAIEKTRMESEDAKKAKELAVLRELQEKYGDQ